MQTGPAARTVLAMALVLGLVLVAPAAPAVASGTPLDLRTRILLQAAMQSYIEERTVAGIFTFADPDTGQPAALHPRAMHTLIVNTGASYVLCFDFLDDGGEEVLLDFYIGGEAGDFTVSEVRVNEREGLLRLIEAGRAWLVE